MAALATAGPTTASMSKIAAMESHTLPINVEMGGLRGALSIRFHVELTAQEVYAQVKAAYPLFTSEEYSLTIVKKTRYVDLSKALKLFIGMYAHGMVQDIPPHTGSESSENSDSFEIPDYYFFRRIFEAI